MKKRRVSRGISLQTTRTGNANDGLDGIWVMQIGGVPMNHL